MPLVIAFGLVFVYGCEMGEMCTGCFWGMEDGWIVGRLGVRVGDGWLWTGKGRFEGGFDLLGGGCERGVRGRERGG